jgi:hypothetical protein
VCTGDERKILLDGRQLVDVDEFVYLGSVISKTGGSEEDVVARISFINLGQVWRSWIYKLKTKLKLFNAVVKSSLMFGCESWVLTKNSEKKLRVFQQRCLRRILRVFYSNLVRNEDILRRTEQRDIVEEIRERRWRRVGHIQRKTGEHLTKEAFGWETVGKRTDAKVLMVIGTLMPI